MRRLLRLAGLGALMGILGWVIAAVPGALAGVLTGLVLVFSRGEPENPGL